MRTLAAATALLFACNLSAAQAQNFPNNPIKIRVPYAAGSSDYQIRALEPALSKLLNGTIVIENQGGAGGQIAAFSVASAPPDGHTLLFSGAGPIVVIPAMRKVEYSIKNFAAIANITATPLLVVVRSEAPYKTIQEFIDYAKKNPRTVTFASSGIGTTPQIVAENFQAAAGIQMTHVPYTGIGQAITGMLSGNSDLYIGIPGSLLPHVNEGKLRVLASTGEVRSEFAPNVPTLRELGLNVTEATKFALFAPASTPEPILSRLREAVQKAVEQTEYQELMKKSFTTIAYMGADETIKSFEADAKVYQEILTRLNLIEK